MGHVTKALLSGWISCRPFPSFTSSTEDSGRFRKRGKPWAQPGHVPTQASAGERKAQRAGAPKAACHGDMSPPGKPECWAGEITDPHYNNERSPVPSQRPSLVTLQWVVSAYSHIPHTEPSEAEAEPRRTLSPSLSPRTRITSRFDSLHTSLLSYPPEHDIYGNLFHLFVLAATPSRPISLKREFCISSNEIKPHPSVRGKRSLPSPLSLLTVGNSLTTTQTA